MRRAAPFVPLLLLAACSGPVSCPPRMAEAAVVEAVFGRHAHGLPRVTDADWDGFLAEEATPRFPDGFTVLDASGQWRGRDGRTEREPAKLLWIVLPGAAPAEAVARLQPVVEAYRRRFGQESVLQAVARRCVGF